MRRNIFIRSTRTNIFFNKYFHDRNYFQLFTDLVPDTCANFLRLCKLKKYGFTGAFVHRLVNVRKNYFFYSFSEMPRRIAKPSWIQIGGSYMKSKNSPCENYYVPHDRRGVMSMCNDGKNNNNSTQFFVCLDPTPWMDTYYVAFGYGQIFIPSKKLTNNFSVN